MFGCRWPLCAAPLGLGPRGLQHICRARQRSAAAARTLQARCRSHLDSRWRLRTHPRTLPRQSEHASAPRRSSAAAHAGDSGSRPSLGDLAAEVRSNQVALGEDFRSLAEFYRLEKGSLEALCARMMEEWRVSDEALRRSIVHRLIVELAFPLVYTTNYDSLLERSYSLTGRGDAAEPHTGADPRLLGRHPHGGGQPRRDPRRRRFSRGPTVGPPAIDRLQEPVTYAIFYLR